MNHEASAEQVRGRAHKPEQCAGFMSVLINEKRISVFHLTTFRRQGCRRKRAQASRRGRIGSTYPKGFKSPSGQERAISSSAEKSRASPTKEKRPSRFSTSDLIRAISSSAGLATSALARSSPRHLQRARSAKFPAPLATSAEREVPRASDIIEFHLFAGISIFCFITTSCTKT